jgi:hypothetical protein
LTVDKINNLRSPLVVEILLNRIAAFSTTIDGDAEVFSHPVLPNFYFQYDRPLRRYCADIGLNHQPIYPDSVDRD